MTKTAVLLSGGVDSLVTAGILKNQGMSLFGIHFYTGYESAQSNFSQNGLLPDELGNPSRDTALEKADFLQQQLEPKSGNVVLIDDNEQFSNFKADLINPFYEDSNVDLSQIAQSYVFSEEDGKVIGQHNGAHFYTIGQRKGLGIGGFEKPLFVIHTNTQTNTIYVGHSDEHPGLYRPALFIPNEDIHWVRPDLELKDGESKAFLTRIRYRQSLEKSTLHKKPDGLYINFENFQRGIAKGQFAAWYLNEELIGSGVIS